MSRTRNVRAVRKGWLMSVKGQNLARLETAKKVAATNRLPCVFDYSAQHTVA